MDLQSCTFLRLEKVPWLGGLAFIFSTLPAIGLYVGIVSTQMPALGGREVSKASPPAIDIRLQLALADIVADNPQDMLSFSLDPPRPDSTTWGSCFLVRLNQSKQFKRVEVPAILELEFGASGTLQFALNPERRFWLDLHLGAAGALEASLFYRTPSGELVPQKSWVVTAQETPIQLAEEFPIDSPFRELGESRWWGSDLFLEKYEMGEACQRLEIGPIAQARLIDVKEGGWIGFKENQWRAIPQLEEAKGLPIARIKNKTPEGLEIEGWEGMSHIRLKLQPMPLVPLKIRAEELFTQLRIRSEKQISCAIEKQCLILKTGDWVIKADQRWKILRKKEEKDAYVRGEIQGDLFVFDRIETKGTGKTICGHYFSAGRTHIAVLDCPVQKRQGTHKARGKSR